MRYRTYQFDKEDLEEVMDNVKATVVEALVRGKFLTRKEGENWCENHTIIMRKKSIFQTISDKFKDAKEADGHIIFIVKKV